MRVPTLIFVIALTMACHQAQAQNDDDNYPILKLQAGSIRGAKAVSRDGRSYYKFLGIPYGKFKRFESPTPADPWDKFVLDATNPGPVCYQKTFHAQEIVGVEDCLVVNVYTPFLPATDSSSKLHVLFFVHGGGFVAGASTLYDPLYFMDEDVVVVTVNYRVGPFGFLNLGIKEAPGNQGVKDVALALRWVRDNVKEFNGDPDRVMIFGESAGGGIVSTLLYSPIAQGLFTGIIVQSGPSLSDLFTNKRPKHYALVLAERVGCKTVGKSLKDVVACMRDKDKKLLVEAFNPMQRDWDNEEEEGEHQYNFSVEEAIKGEQAALPELPHAMLAKGNYVKVPVMLGVNKYETWDWAEGLLSSEEFRQKLDKGWNRAAPNQFFYTGYGDQAPEGKNPKRDAFSQKIREFYFKDAKTPLKDDPSIVRQFEKLLSDRLENHPTRKMALTLAKYDVPTYLYMFDKPMSEGGLEVTPQHAEELNYLFEVPPPDGRVPAIGRECPDYEFSKNLIKLWVSFAKEGRPGHVWGEESNQAAWKQLGKGVKAKALEWHHIDDDGITPRKEDTDFRGRMEFWDEAEREMIIKQKPGGVGRVDFPTGGSIEVGGVTIKKKKKDEL